MFPNDQEVGGSTADLERAVARQLAATVEAELLEGVLTAGDPTVSTSEPLTFEKVRRLIESLTRSMGPSTAAAHQAARRLAEFNRATRELEKRGLEDDWTVQGPRADFPFRFYLQHRHTGIVTSPAILYAGIDVVSRFPGPGGRVWPRLPRKTKKAIRTWRAMRGRRELRRVRRWSAKGGRRSLWGIT
jgi:hypothetical protein